MSNPAIKEGELLKNGTTLSAGGLTIEVISFLKHGGQGEVYHVQASNGKPYALKWYFPPAATETQRRILKQLISMPSPDSRLVWPLAIVEQPSIAGFGFLMDLVDRLVQIGRVVHGRVPARQRPKVMAMAQIANTFLQLHSKGLFYGDVNLGNFFIDPLRGDLRIIDCDGIQVEGTGDATVMGLGEFRAPEIVRGEATPSKYTDQHSLAVLFFQMLVPSHPFEGRLIDEIPGFLPNKDTIIYGQPSPFIFHPTDASNATQDTGVVSEWNRLPNFIRKLFLDAFVHKVNVPMGRVVETTWQKAMLKLHDSVVPCKACGREHFYDAETLVPGNTHIGPCQKCKTLVKLPPRLRLQRDGDHTVAILSPSAELYAPHIGERESWDLCTPLAIVEEHPKVKGVLGLKNSTDRSWLCTQPDGSRCDVPPQSRVRLANGTKIQFGRVKGEFRC